VFLLFLDDDIPVNINLLKGLIMKLIKKNKHNSITKKLFEVQPHTASGFILLVSSPNWYTVKVKTIYRTMGCKNTVQWFGKTAIAELAKMTKLV
jgi:hypothetical protein